MSVRVHSTGHHTPAVTTESTVSTEELFLISYCIVDDLCPDAAPDWIRLRTGTGRMAMTDSEIITLSIMQEGRSNDSELSFHRVVQKDYRHLVPDLICRSRYHRRRKDLMGIHREMPRLLMNRRRLLAMWLSIDAAPITTAESPRWKSARLSIWAAEAASVGLFSLGERRRELLDLLVALLERLARETKLKIVDHDCRKVAEHAQVHRLGASGLGVIHAEGAHDVSARGHERGPPRRTELLEDGQLTDGP